MVDLTRVLLIVALLLFSAFFSMTESALSFSNQIKLKVKADEGSKSAKKVLKILNKFDDTIVTILIGNNIVNILISVFTTMITFSIFKDIYPTNADEYSAIVSTIVATIVVFIFGEVLPKTIAQARPEKIAQIMVYPIIIFGYIIFPVAFIFKCIVRFGRKIFKTKSNDNLLSEEDLKDIVDNIEQEGQIDEDENEIIQSAVDFDDLKVKEVMCPKENICAYDLELNYNEEQLIDFIVDNNYSRIPVYRKNINNIIGILHTRVLLKELMNKQPYDIEKLLVPPLIVRPNMHLDTIFEEFKKKKTHIAIVINKDNETLGLVTMEDVLEELVGDIDESNEGGSENE